MTYLYRKILPEIQKNLIKEEISVILGPRQAGKTTIIMKIKQELENRGQKTAYFNLDILEDRAHFTTQHAFIKKLELLFGKNSAVVFIDEIQRLTNAGLFLKGLYDMHTPYKLIVTGSGSLELKANVIESLVGRKKVFHVWPMSFEEFILHKAAITQEHWNDFFLTEPAEGLRLFSEYCIYGGYPKVVLAHNTESKLESLADLFNSYVGKDIEGFIGREKGYAFQRFVRYCAGTIGSLINRAEVARNLGITERTVAHYLDLLEKTFIIRILPPYTRNITKEITKSPKLYFIDCGLRNYAVQNFQEFGERIDKGGLFENFIFRKLLDLQPFPPIAFWRTQAGAEVDFIIDANGKPTPIEAKSASGKQKISRGFRSFISAYHPITAFLYSLGAERYEAMGDTHFFSIPYWDSFTNKQWNTENKLK